MAEVERAPGGGIARMVPWRAARRRIEFMEVDVALPVRLSSRPPRVRASNIYYKSELAAMAALSFPRPLLYFLNINKPPSHCLTMLLSREEGEYKDNSL